MVFGAQIGAETDVGPFLLLVADLELEDGVGLAHSEGELARRKGDFDGVALLEGEEARMDVVLY